jgi:YidC/Oxa1 family membrane protein insertase
LGPAQESLGPAQGARAGGAEVVKKYRFHRAARSSSIVSYEVTNKTDKPLRAHAYFQFLRDGNPPSEQAAQTNAFAGRHDFHGPGGLYRGDKFEKVDFGTSPRAAGARRKREGRLIAIIQHYCFCMAPKPGMEREYFHQPRRRQPYTAGVVVRSRDRARPGRP